ncbi:hypothetical protein [Paenisporosarcina indica]|nr:hypothetical protein [Paenisporosarcina indica]
MTKKEAGGNGFESDLALMAMAAFLAIVGSQIYALDHRVFN